MQFKNISKIIEQQAAHYVLTVDQFTDLMSDAAAYQDYVEYYDE